LAVEPEVILSAVPTSALEPISNKWLEEKFVVLRCNYTIESVTSILWQARRIADYIIFMYLGEIIEQGPAIELLENPKEKLTREYVKGVIC
jgi:phosphate transport system ATP-binding protein